MSIKEQVVIFLHTIGHNVRFRVAASRFHRSVETIHRYFRVVLKGVFLLYKHVVRLPDNETHPDIRNNRRFYPYFKDCIGVIDGTHIRASVPIEIQGRFRGRKDGTTQNVLAAITFDLKFCYVLAGWEGSAHDSRVLDDALHRSNGLKIPEGKYYLGDAGYGNRIGILSPYRKVRYHLQEFSDHPPENARELFNLRHSSLRTTIERGFGVLKKRFRVLGAEPFWSFETQVEVVLACCVLHNHIKGVDPDDPIMGDTASEVGSQRIVHQTRREAQEESREWNDKRDEISEAMWNDYVTNRTMAKNKEKEGKGCQFRWSTPMHVMLLDILEEEALKGNKPSNTFKPQSFARVAKEISERFGVTCIPDHVSNRLRTIRTTWKTIQTVRNNSGFGWDDNLKMITCDPKTQDEYLMANPTHVQYLNKKIEFYDKMAIVVGKDVATGSYAYSWGDETSHNPPVELDGESDSTVKEKNTDSSSSKSKERSHRKRSREAKGESNYSEVAAQLKEIAIAFKNSTEAVRSQGPVDIQ
uniref:DDE Tnp4 domain-containing protein n=1 Tax=Fagus sylvatica TaxID=28930 RepID=A0A2N9GSH5_FAGSY